MKNKYFLLAAVAILAAACNNDESENLAEADNAIRLSSSIDGQTRASDELLETNFANGTTVKVQVTDNAESDKVTYAPVEYTANGSGGLNAGDNTQYFPISGSSVDIYAYYPSDASTASNGFSVKTDQSSDANYESSDLMYASISNITKTSTAEQRKLNFGHLLSKVVVTLAKGNGITDDEINSATVTLKDVIIKGTFTPGSAFSAATDEAGNKGDIIIATNAGTTAHAAIVVPQTMTGKKLEIQIGSVTKEYTFLTSTFAAATHNDYTITVKKTVIEVTSTIGAWGAGTTGSEPLTF